MLSDSEINLERNELSLPDERRKKLPNNEINIEH